MIFSVRGTLGSTMILADNTGLLIAYILGHYTDYHTTPHFMIGLTITCGLLLTIFPESPIFLMKRGKARVSTQPFRSHFLRNNRDGFFRKPKMQFVSIKI